MYVFSREHRLIFQRQIEVPPPLSQRIAEFVRRPEATNEELSVLVAEVKKSDEKASVMESALVHLRNMKLTEKEQEMITNNIDTLDERVLEQMEEHERSLVSSIVCQWLEEAKKAVNQEAPSPSDHPAEEIKKQEEQTWTEWSGEKWEGVKDWSKENLDVTKWSPTKRAIAATVTLGLAGLAAWWLWRRSKKKDSGEDKEEGEKKSSFWKWLLWVPVVGLVGYGVYRGVEWAKENLNSWEKAKTWMEDKMKSVEQKYKEMINSKETKEENRYELSEKKYKEMEEEYFRHREKAVPCIRERFAKEQNPHVEKFLAAMREKHKVITENGIEYTSMDVALKMYGRQFGLFYTECGNWLENHWGELAVLACIAQRSGALGVMGSGTAFTAEKSLAFANALKNYSFDHPIIAFMFLGGSVGALGGAFVSADMTGAGMPSNLQSLTLTMVNNAPIVRGATALSEAAQASIREVGEAVKKVGEITGDLGKWIAKNLVGLKDEIVKRTPEIMRLTEEEIVFDRHEIAFAELGEKIEEKAQGRGIGTPEAGAVFTQAFYSDLCRELGVFAEKFHAEKRKVMRGETVDPASHNALLSAYTALQNNLQKIGIVLTLEDGMCQWNIPEDGAKDHPRDFCVDPNELDRGALLDRSRNIVNTDDGIVTITATSAQERLRELVEKNSLDVSWLTENRWVGAVGMIIGNTFCALPIKWEKFGPGANDWRPIFLSEVIKAPLDVVVDFPGMPWSDKDFKHWGATLVSASVTTTMFSVSAGILGRMRSLVTGGKAVTKATTGIYQYKTARAVRFLVKNVVPGVSPARAAWDIALRNEDIWIITKFGYLEGRRINVILSSVNVKPQWIRNVMFCDTLRTLQKIATNVGLKWDSKWSLPEARLLLRDHIAHKLETASAEKILTTDPHKLARAIIGGYADIEVGSARYQVFDEVAMALRPGKISSQELIARGISLRAVIRGTKDISELDELIKLATETDDIAFCFRQLPRAQQMKHIDAFVKIVGSVNGPEDIAQMGIPIVDIVDLAIDPRTAGKFPASFINNLGEYCKNTDVRKLQSIAVGPFTPLPNVPQPNVSVAASPSTAGGGNAPPSSTLGNSSANNPGPIKPQAQPVQTRTTPPPDSGASGAIQKNPSPTPPENGNVQTATKKPKVPRNRMSSAVAGGDGASLEPLYNRPSAEQIAKAVPEGKPTAEVAQGAANKALRAADKSAEVKEITKLDDAAKTLKNVARSAEPLKEASKYAKAMKALTAIGVAGDVAGIAIAGYEMKQTAELIKNTPKEKDRLRGLYARRYVFQAGEIGVGAVGIGVVVGGVSGTIATPIVIATIPLSATIGAGYRLQQWDEAVARDYEDWRREGGSTEERLADVRKRSFGETTDLGLSAYAGDGWWNRLFAITPAGVALLPTRFAGNLQKTVAQWQTINAEKLRSIAEDMTFVQIPEVVCIRHSDGRMEERDINDDEKKEYLACAKIFRDAMAEYITKTSFQKDGTVAAGSLEMLARTLENARAYGQLMHDRHVRAKRGTSIPEDYFPSKKASVRTQAEVYANAIRGDRVAALFNVCFSALNQEGASAESLRDVFTLDIAGVLQAETETAQIAFRTRMLETNFRDWKTDGDAAAVVEMHVADLFSKDLDRESGALADLIVKLAGDVTTASSPEARVKALAEIKSAYEEARANLRVLFTGRDTKAFWDGLQAQPERLQKLRNAIKLHALQTEEEEIIVRLAADKRIAPKDKHRAGKDIVYDESRLIHIKPEREKLEKMMNNSPL